MKEMLASRHDSPKQEPVVQYCCAGTQEGWRSLHFCIDFCKLNAWGPRKTLTHSHRYRKWSRSLVGTGYFSCLDLKAGFRQIMMVEASKQYTAFTVGNIGFFECECMPLGLCNASATFQRLMQNCLGELNLIYCLIYLDDIIVFFFKDRRGTLTLPVHYVQVLQGAQPEAQANQVWILQEWRPTTWLIMSPMKGVQPSKENLKAVAWIALHHRPAYQDPSLFGLGGTLPMVYKGVHACIMQPLHKHLSGEGTSKKNKWCNAHGGCAGRLLRCT